MANEVGVEVGIDGKAFDQSVKQMETSINNLGRSIENSFKNSSRSVDTFKGTLAGLATFKIAESIASGFAKIGESISEAIGIASGKEAELKKLENAFIRTGLGGKNAVNDFAEFADEIERTTKFTDDAALSAATMLTNLTKLNKQGIKEATLAATDLASIIGTDLAGATELLIKATEGNVTSLKRQGIVIQEGKTNAETYANTLKKIAEFSGSAKSEMNAFSAAQNQLKKSYENVLESMGNVIIKNPLIIGLFKAMTGNLNNLDESIKSNFESFQKLVSGGINYALAFGKTFLDFLDVLARAFRTVGVVVINAATLPLRAFGVAIQNVLETAGNAVSIFDEEIGKKIQSFAEKAKTVNTAIENSVSISDAISEKSIFGVYADGLDKMALKANEFYFEQAKKEKENGDNRKNSEIEVSKAILDERAKLQADILGLQEKQKANEAFGQTLDTGTQLTPEEEAQAVLARETAKADAEYQVQLMNNARLADAQTQKLANEKAYLELSNKTLEAQNKYKEDLNKRTRDKELKDQEAFFSAASSLSNAKNKELAAIGKAAAITQIAIKTPPAIASSFEFGTKLGGPVLGFTFGAIAAAAMAAQAANIAGVAFEKGGIVPGQSYSGDNIQARVNSGEMVLNRQQQAELFNVANGGGGGNNQLLSAINALGDRIEGMQITVQANGREIARLIREENRNGFSFA